MRAKGEDDVYNWLLPHHVLADPPSAKDGVPPEQERALRAFGCDVIRDAAALLGAGAAVSCKAQALLQRAYYHLSLRSYDVVATAAACLNTASKLDQVPLPLHVILESVYRVLQRRGGARSVRTLDKLRPEYRDLRDAIDHTEKSVLRAIGFAICVEPAHCHLLLYAKLLGFPFHDNAVPQTALDMLTDSYRTALHCRFAGSVVACACLYLSMRHHRRPGPSGEWWRLYDTDTVDLVECVKALADMYTWPAPRYTDLRCREVALPQALRV
eukprot:TRINITY_DN9936_c0_g1_i2.p1 TRINITY_DN9936_c0_g1~~TRINITY_DN9936_c0_g1_i2.p1  ORF type:complete len:270 (+),score=85.28 TRINITY_DN9936_c0_g1_i2:105-914(+)